jgi:GT2 family glycosyltransferase
MPKVTVVQVIYNNRRFIEPVFSAIFNQTYKDFNVVAVISGNEDKGKELLMEKFPQVEIIDPGYNIGFAAGHNLVFTKYGTLTRPSDGHPLPKGEGNNEKATEFFQLVNPDLIMEPDYIEQMLKAFADPKVGAATGKLFKYDFGVGAGLARPISDAGGQRPAPTKTNTIDSTGVTISKSGRARDRGQHEVDRGQYDNQILVDAVSGAGCMYRRAALEKIKMALISTTPSRQGGTPLLSQEGNTASPAIQRSSPPGTGGVPSVAGGGGRKFEYFDEDFHSYWEDVDLSWRMSNAGWKNVFVPAAIGYHGRGAGSSKKGYADVLGFIRHHKNLPPRVRQLNYQNHIFLYIKNMKYFYPQFFFREFFMLGYILFFEQGTLKVLPQMFKLFPKMWKKRKIIKFNITRGHELC